MILFHHKVFYILMHCVLTEIAIERSRLKRNAFMNI